MFNKKHIAGLTLLAGIICSGTASADWSNKTRAFAMVPSSQDSLCSEGFRQSIQNYKSIGANTLSIVVAYYQENLTSSDIYPYRRTTTDEALVCGINYLQSQGMDFGINMVINVPAWRANIDPIDRDEWFRQMGALATRYARDFAAVYGAKHMSVGTEMYKLVSNDYDERNAAAPGRYRWPQIVSDIRAHYNGTITYSAQHSGDRSAIFNNNDLIPNLDILGFSAYFPLYASDHNGLLQEWARIERETILPAFNRYGKNMVVSELGYRPCDFTFTRPYDSQTACEYDGDKQAVAWDAMLLFFEDKSYLDGMIGGWAWSDDPDKGGFGHTDYTPWNKPASNTFRNYWPIIDGSSGNTDGFVFARTDSDEFRWVRGSQNVWISEACAISLGGATQSGRWSALNAIAPGFDQAADPCSGGTANPTPVDPVTPTTGGYVFARTDSNEFRWVEGSRNLWITETCATNLGGATQMGTWSDLNAVAPGFDQANDPCTGATPGGGGTPPVTADGYVFARADSSEFRWVSGTNNLWITSDCAASLGGATQTGTWSDLNDVAPGFDQASDPCNGPSPGNGGIDMPGDGFVFSRSDKDEFRWVSGMQNVWITESCAASLGGATQSGTWSDLNVIAPEFDTASDPCSGTTATPPTNNADGFVFARSDSSEFRWVVGSNNIWIPESCAIALGGTTLAGTWSELNAIAPGFDRAENPCQ